MTNIAKDFTTVVDVEPLLIVYSENGCEVEWENPFIDSWYDVDSVLHVDPAVHRIIFKTEDNTKTTTFYFKSNYVNQKTYECYSDDLEGDILNYVDLNAVATYIIDGIISDAYIPRPKLKEPVKTAKEYAQMRMRYPAKPLISTDIGNKLVNFSTKEIVIVDFLAMTGFVKINDSDEYVFNCVID